jgi:hypothetical protein
MNTYIFQGDLLCEDCAKAEMDFLRSLGKEPPAIDDSDEWPVGPFPNGGGEADCPMYCGGCGVFLENPLTTDGERYVLSVAKEGKAPVEWLEIVTGICSRRWSNGRKMKARSRSTAKT